MSFLSSLHNKSAGIALLRVLLAVIFIYHGFDKVSNMGPVVMFFGTLGFAPFVAYFVAWLELLGGIALLAGFYTREIALSFAIIMLVAIFKVHLNDSVAILEGKVLLFAVSLALIFTGAGKYSFSKDKVCGNCKDGVCQCKK